MRQLSLELERDLTGLAMPLPEDIEQEVIAQLAEAIKVVHDKAEEVGDEETLNQ